MMQKGSLYQSEQSFYNLWVYVANMIQAFMACQDEILVIKNWIVRQWCAAKVGAPPMRKLSFWGVH